MIITSRQNALVQKVISLNNKKNRGIYGEFIVEGENFIPYAKTLIFSESYFNKNNYDGNNFSIVSDEIFEKLTDTKNPQGVLGIAQKLDVHINTLKPTLNSTYIIAENLNDPGNLGTVIRTADATGVSAVIMLDNCVDVYSPKVVRSSAGSIFNVPIVYASMDETVHFCKCHEIKIISTYLSTNNSPYDIDLSQKCAIIVGNEANGISEVLVEKSDILVKLPIIGKAESLNVSVAASVMMYEVLRQKLNFGG